jgi:hypothetical protein
MDDEEEVPKEKGRPGSARKGCARDYRIIGITFPSRNRIGMASISPAKHTSTRFSSSLTTPNPPSPLQLPLRARNNYPNHSTTTTLDLRLRQLLTPRPSAHPHLQAPLFKPNLNPDIPPQFLMAPRAHSGLQVFQPSSKCFS